MHNASAQVFLLPDNARIDHKFTLGFERQVYSLYTPTLAGPSEKVRASEARFNRILLRIKLTNKFRVQTGLSYKDIDRILCNSGKCKAFNMLGNYQLSVPLTIQYQLLDQKYRLHPYFGMGVQYNYQPGSIATNSKDVIVDPTIANRLRYLNIIFTEGLIYDVTPDLQITQSIHVIPQNGTRQVGLNVGIGYRIK